jgi:hypothetical protein
MLGGKIWGRPSRLVLATLTAAASTLVIAAVAMATGTSTVSFRFTPSTAPTHRFEAGGINIHLRTAVTDDTRTDRVQFDFDDDFRFAPGAVPTCTREDIAGPIDMAQAMTRCGSAAIGSGTAQATNNTTIFNACVLAFNGAPSDDGVPTVLLFARAQISLPSAIDCSHPRSNHSGNTNVLLVGPLRHSAAGSDYRRVLSFDHLTAASPFPTTDLDLTLHRGRYVSARCASDQAFGDWLLRTEVGYVEPSSVQTLDSTQRCATRAPRNTVRTRFVINGVTTRASGFHLTLYGHLNAATRRCRANRKAVLYFNREDKRHRRDSDWSSRNGAIALQGHWDNTPRRFIVKVRRKRVGSAYTCSRARYVSQIDGSRTPRQPLELPR